MSRTPREWRTHLTPLQQDAIVEAANRAVEIGRTSARIERSDFELDVLRPTVVRCAEALDEGRGFVLLRGFPIEELSPEATELAYLGLGMQLGTPVGQDADASSSSAMFETRASCASDPSVRLYRTRERQDFHTDGSDIVGLLCLQRAKSGGESRIASSFAVYNEILRRRPDLVEVLYEPMYWDRNDEQSPGEDPFFALPVLSDVGGLPRIFYIGWYIRDAQRHPQVPRLTSPQQDALDLIESIANESSLLPRDGFQSPVTSSCIANAKILHCREAFDDHDEPRPSTPPPAAVAARPTRSPASTMSCAVASPSRPSRSSEPATTRTFDMTASESDKIHVGGVRPVRQRCAGRVRQSCERRARDGTASGLFGRTLCPSGDDTEGSAPGRPRRRRSAAAIRRCGSRRCGSTMRGESSLTWARAAASTCCCRPAGWGRRSMAYGLDMTPRCSISHGGIRLEAGVTNVEFLPGHDRRHSPAWMRWWTS